MLSLLKKIVNKSKLSDIEKFHIRQLDFSKLVKDVERIALLYYIPKENTEKYNNWEDGFTKAIDLLSEDFEITKYNLYDIQPSANELNQYDLVIGKSCWGWIVDNYIQSLKHLNTRKGIVVSCSKAPQKDKALFYDIVWYETEFYEKLIDFHPNAYRAFGINSDVFKPLNNIKKDIDVLGIGAITAYKRFHKLNEIDGNKKVIIGTTNTPDFDNVRDLLSSDIEIIEYLSQKELARYINRSKLVYIPCEINGGGERAVLESLSCGANVCVENDNPKLQQLLSSKNHSKYDYYNALVSSIKLSFNKKVLQTNLILSKGKLSAGRYSFFNKNFKIKGGKSISIGSFCSFGENITLITENHDTNYASTQGFVYRLIFKNNHPGEHPNNNNPERSKGPIEIGNDVWIGDNVMIMSGVKIGNGACIAGGSIVTKDIPDYCIAGGVPAKVLKNRFNNETINLLQDLKWWNWTDKKIKDNEAFFNLNFNIHTTEYIKKIIK